MLEIEYLPRAIRDLESLYIHRRFHSDSDSASRLLDSIYETIEKIASFPNMGAEAASPSGITLKPFRRFLKDGFWIYYTVEDSVLVIWRIFHSREEIDDYSLVNF